MFVCVAWLAELFNNTCGEVVIMLAFHSELEIRGAASGTGSIPVRCIIHFSFVILCQVTQMAFRNEENGDDCYLKFCCSTKTWILTLLESLVIFCDSFCKMWDGYKSTKKLWFWRCEAVPNNVESANDFRLGWESPFRGAQARLRLITSTKSMLKKCLYT